jgi:hypothetical protein
VALMQQNFPFIPSDRRVMERELEVYSALARSIPVYSLDYPRQYERLDAVCETLVRHIQSATDIHVSPP